MCTHGYTPYDEKFGGKASMSLTATNVKLDGDDIEMINQQLVDIEKQMEWLTLEKSFYCHSYKH
jgi:hypothetical protein